MRRPWFATRPVDETFFDTAPFRLQEGFDIPRPASDVWAELTDERPLAWCRILQDVAWTSPRPFGVGTTRTVRALGGVNVLREWFFRWEEGRRFSFFALEASVPLFRRFAEDYLVEDTSESSCRFTWTIAITPSALGKPGAPINRLVFGGLFRDTGRYFNAA